MTWRNGDLLWLLLLVPIAAALLVTAWRMRVRATKRFGTESALASLVVGRSGALRAVRGTLLVLGIGLVAIALAGPQYGSRTRILRKRGIDVVVALDFSKSMLARDVRPSRIDRAKAELTRFLHELDGDRVGIVAFAGDTMEFPMTYDYSALGLFFRDLGPYDMPVGGTAIGRALTAAKQLLDRSDPASNERTQTRSERSRVVILLTDGEDHEGDPIEAARALADGGAKVFVVGIGSRTGEPIPTYAPDGTWTGYMRDENGQPVTTALTAENESQLREIASVSSGQYFRARQGTVGMDQIRTAMRRLKQEERKARRVVDAEDRYALVLLPGFLLIVLEGILPEGWLVRRRRKSNDPPERAAKKGAA